MRLALLMMAFGLAACAEPEPADQPRGNEAERPTLQIADIELRIHSKVNAVRRDEGLPPYEWRAVLARVAQAHSCDMAQRGFFDHVAPDGSTPTQRAYRRGVTCRTQGIDGQALLGVSENLFRTWLYSGYEDWTQGASSWRVYEWQTADDIAQATVNGWLDSPAHRQAMLDPTSEDHGIGVCIGEKDVVLVAQVMC